MRRFLLFIPFLLAAITLLPGLPVQAHAGTSANIRETIIVIAETPTEPPEATASATATKSGPTEKPSATPRPSATSDVVEVIKSTAEEDGSVIHVVEKGQALWSIAMAYNTSVEQLIGLNNLPTEPVLQIGQKLVVVPPYTATPTPTASNTPYPPTPTATRTLRPMTVGPTATLTPTPTSTSAPLFAGVDALKGVDRRSMGIGLIIICALGLGGLVGYTIKRKKDEAPAPVDPVEDLLSEKQEHKR